MRPYSTRRSARALLVFLLVVAALPVLAAVSVAVADPGRGFEWPVRGRIVRGFAPPSGPYGEGGHQGVDMEAQPGTEVRAPGAGTVAWVGEVPRGRFVSIEHGGGVRTVLLDLDRIDVAGGRRVRAGEVIGTAGGLRDDSSSEPHLHFGAYISGVPVDPHLLVNGFDPGSFIRLCPVERPVAGGARRGTEAGRDRGLLSRTGSALRTTLSRGASPLAAALRYCASGCAAAGRTLFRAARSVAGAATHAWSRGIAPAFRRAARSVAGAFRWAWSNRWVQAVVAGIAAAIIIVAGVVVAVLVIGISVTVGIAAAIAGVVACIAMAVVYAATHQSDFTFAHCFYKSLAAGCAAAGLAGTATSLATAFSAGWAELGLLGTVKSAFWSGFNSALFETSWGYLVTGELSWKKALVAFGVGAVSGAVGKLLIKGLRSSHRVAELMVFGAEGTRRTVIEGGRSLVTVIEGFSVRGFLVSVKTVAIRFSVKSAYVGFSGTFATGVHAATCLVTGQPVTLAGSLAAFVTGGLMGVVALGFRARGLGGALERLALFRDGRLPGVKKVVTVIGGKLLRKGLNTGSRELFRRITREEAAR